MISVHRDKNRIYVKEGGGKVQSDIVNLACTFLGKLISRHLAEISLGIQPLLRPEVGIETAVNSLQSLRATLRALLWSCGPGVPVTTAGTCHQRPSLLRPGLLHPPSDSLFRSHRIKKCQGLE